ncbi:MAG: hypothetical protein ACK5SQ_12865 [Chitinophagales bacterium]
MYLVEVDQESAQNNDLKEIAADTFKGRALISSKELRQIHQDTFGVQDRTARSYVKMMLDAKIIEKSNQFPSDFRLILP